MTEDEYLTVLCSRMQADGFAECHRKPRGVPVERAFRRRHFALTKFGIVDTFCLVECADEELTPTTVESFSEQAFKFALDNKVWLPRGCGGTAVVYSLFVTGAVSEGVRSFVKGYHPIHWASFEFPAVAELSSGRLLYCTSAPLWGAVYYRGFRAEAEGLFSLPR